MAAIQGCSGTSKVVPFHYLLSSEAIEGSYILFSLSSLIILKKSSFNDKIVQMVLFRNASVDLSQIVSYELKLRPDEVNRIRTYVSSPKFKRKLARDSANGGTGKTLEAQEDLLTDIIDTLGWPRRIIEYQLPRYKTHKVTFGDLLQPALLEQMVSIIDQGVTASSTQSNQPNHTNPSNRRRRWFLIMLALGIVTAIGVTFKDDLEPHVMTWWMQAINLCQTQITRGQEFLVELMEKGRSSEDNMRMTE